MHLLYGTARARAHLKKSREELEVMRTKNVDRLQKEENAVLCCIM